MRFAILLLILVAMWPATAPAKEPIRQLQEELRKRKVFFGDVDGRDSEALRAALQHYQGSRGLAKTGQLDERTRETLDLPAPIGELGFPEGLVLRSDPAPREEPVRSRIPGRGDRPRPQMVDTQVMAKTDAAVLKTAAASATAALEKRMHEFIVGYLADAETNRHELEMSYYAPVVDYFDHGEKPSSFVGADVEAYYQRWPNRHYELRGPVRVSRVSENLWDAEFEVGFAVEGEDRQAKGRVAERFTVDTSGSRWQIVRMKEQRLP